MLSAEAPAATSAITGGRLRLLSWALLAVVCLGALVYGATDDGAPRSDAERAADLAGSIACPKCQGQPVSESNAPVAEVIRTEIKRQVDAGLTDAEIRAFYVARYGEWVDLNPSRSGLTGLVWVTPFLLAGVAAGVLALAFSRWRVDTDNAARASSQDRDLVARALSGDAGSTAEAVDGEVHVDEAGGTEPHAHDDVARGDADGNHGEGTGR